MIHFRNLCTFFHCIRASCHDTSTALTSNKPPCPSPGSFVIRNGNLRWSLWRVSRTTGTGCSHSGWTWSLQVLLDYNFSPETCCWSQWCWAREVIITLRLHSAISPARGPAFATSHSAKLNYSFQVHFLPFFTVSQMPILKIHLLFINSLFSFTPCFVWLYWSEDTSKQHQSQLIRHHW